MEKFACKTQILSAPGALCALKELSSHRLLLICDPFFLDNGVAREVLQLTSAEKTEILEKPTLTAQQVAEATEAMRKFQPDTVVALGGGSTIDCAKAIRHFSGMDVKLVAVPTTSGAGSEVTDAFLLTHQGVQYGLKDDKMQPDVAILDSRLLDKIPAGQIADTGFDALSHSLEAYVATKGGMISDCLAAGAFSTLVTALPASYGGDRSVRQKLHTAATMAGMAVSQAGLGLCHAMANSLGGMFPVPHGQLSAILLPSVIRLNAAVCQDKYARLARFAEIAGSTDTVAVRNLIQTLIRLRRQLALPDDLQQAGIAPEKVRFASRELVKTTLNDPCCRTNPVRAEAFIIRRILEEITREYGVKTLYSWEKYHF